MVRWGFVLALCCAALVLPASGGAMLDWHAVRITPTGPEPRVISVLQHASAVAWYNAGARATRVSISGASCSVPVTSSASMLRGCTFARPGRYAYRIAGVPARYASGVVVVRAFSGLFGPP